MGVGSRYCEPNYLTSGGRQTRGCTGEQRRTRQCQVSSGGGSRIEPPALTGGLLTGVLSRDGASAPGHLIKDVEVEMNTRGGVGIVGVIIIVLVILWIVGVIKF